MEPFLLIQAVLGFHVAEDERTYVILEILEEGYQLKVYDIDNGELPIYHKFFLYQLVDREKTFF